MRLGSVATKTGNNWEDLSVNLIACYCSERENVLAPGRPIACGSCDKVDRKGNRGPGLIAFKLTPPAPPCTWPVTSLFLPIRPEWMTPVFISTITPLLRSSFLAAQTNNSCPPGLRRTRGFCPAGDFECTSVAVPHAGPSSNIQPHLVMCTLITFAGHWDTISPQVTWTQRRLTTCVTIGPRAVLYVTGARLPAHNLQK